MSRLYLIVNHVPIVYGWDPVLQTFFFQAHFDDQGIPAIDSGTECHEFPTMAALEARFATLMGMPAPNFAHELQVATTLKSSSTRTRTITT